MIYGIKCLQNVANLIHGQGRRRWCGAVQEGTTTSSRRFSPTTRRVTYSLPLQASGWLAAHWPQWLAGASSSRASIALPIRSPPIKACLHATTGSSAARTDLTALEGVIARDDIPSDRVTQEWLEGLLGWTRQGSASCSRRRRRGGCPGRRLRRPRGRAPPATMKT